MNSPGDCWRPSNLGYGKFLPYRMFMIGISAFHDACFCDHPLKPPSIEKKIGGYLLHDNGGNREATAA